MTEPKIKCPKCRKQMTKTYKGPKIGEEFPEYDEIGLDKYPQLGWLCFGCGHYMDVEDKEE